MPNRFELLRNDDGFSLMELLAAMAIGGVVLTALMSVFTTGIRATGRITDRVDSSQRGRVALDRINTLLNSQVCLRDTTTDAANQIAIPPIDGANSTGSSVTFYADLDGASDTPDKYRLTYDATAKTLTETRYAGAGRLPSVTFSATPTYTRRLADNVVPVGSTSIFTYYKFAADGSVDLSTPITPSASNQSLIVRENVQFRALSTISRVDNATRSDFQTDGIAATADPTDPDLTACPG
jgi:prepilin-type N-terminal cleavage/methylation domain-containing protein